MEVDLTASDDPPESHDQSQDGDTLLDHTLPLELAHQLPETASCNEQCDQDETHPEESATDNLHIDSKASGKTPCKMQQGAIFSGKILSFCCSECKDDTTYSPNDLLKHFQGSHKGTLPTYPCDLCSFVTNEFSSLQRHRIGHRNTLVTCEICNDGVQYSLLLLTRHFTNCHSRNGQFRCKKCEFSTRDAGTFVQHTHRHNERNHKCVKCLHGSPTQGELQKHNLVHSGTFPFSCQMCGYSAARREYLNKHLTVAHGEEMNKRRANEDNSGVNSTGLKLLLKKSPPGGGSRESQWMSKLNSLPGVGLLDHNGRLFNPEKTLEETQQFLERAVGVKKENNKWTKSPVQSEPQTLHLIPSTMPQPKLQEHEISPGLLNSTNNNGLTVLMVKNKISIPPNCTTKVMGFKIVDGKKHLVLKVIPTKPEDSTENEVSDSHIGDDEDKTTSSPCSSSSPSIGSLLSLESGESNEPSSIKESPEVENHIGNHLNLTEEHKVSFKIASKAWQVNNEDTEVSHGVKVLSTASKDVALSLCQCRQSSGSSSPHLHEVSFLCSSEKSYIDDIQTANPAATSPVSKSVLSSAGSETTLSDLQIAQVNPSEYEATALASVMDQPSRSQSPADETTHPSCDSSNSKSDPEVSVDDKFTHVDILESKLPNIKTTDATFSVLSEESLIQEPRFSSKGGKPCKNNFDPSCPIKRSVEKNIIDSVAAEGQDSNSHKVVTTFCEMTDIKTFNAKVGETSQFYPNASFETKASDSVVGKFSEVTKNKTTEANSQNETSKGASPDAKDCNTEVENNLLNSPSQEVFSFHNYSKDSFGSSPDSLQPEEDLPLGLEEEECEEDFGDWSLTLPASPPLPVEEDGKGVANESDRLSESGEKALERVSDSDIEVDECIATVDDSLISVLPEKELETACSSSSEKKPEGITFASENTAASLTSAAVLGKILEKHSDAIISQQLEKERMRSSGTGQETVRPTKTTLRILQTPEGKQQMFLQTTDTPYAVPVQLKSGAGFKLITKSSSPKINVSYVKPGIETASKTKGIALTLNGGRIGMSAQSSTLETKGQTSIQMAPSGSGNRYFVNAAALKASLLFSGAVKSSSGEQATNVPQTCYLVQRSLPVTPVSTESNGPSSKTVLATRPVLAMPVNSADKTSPLQSGRQAYLVRYISPAKSGILLNNSDGKALNQGNQVNEAGKNRVFLKIVRGPNGTRFLSTAPYTTAKKSVYLATSSLQSPCLLMSSNKSLANVSAGLKTSTNSQGLAHKLIPASQLKHIFPQSNVQNKSRADHDVALQKLPLVPCPIRPRSQRKRRRRALFEEMLEGSSKMRRISSKSSEKDATSIWEPVAKDVMRMLRLCPFSPLQEIKCPRRNQPVVVLNHPDADIPEVSSIMRSVNKYKGEVLQVTLSQSTVKALSESPNRLSKQNASNGNGSERSRPVGGTVQERFILKLKLKKTSRNKYEVVRSSSAGSEQQSTFCCWFCGRVFNNQEDWIGHGQRHLMEATRDWNKLF